MLILGILTLIVTVIVGLYGKEIKRHVARVRSSMRTWRHRPRTRNRWNSGDEFVYYKRYKARLIPTTGLPVSFSDLRSPVGPSVDCYRGEILDLDDGGRLVSEFSPNPYDSDPDAVRRWANDRARSLRKNWTATSMIRVGGRKILRWSTFRRS